MLEQLKFLHTYTFAVRTWFPQPPWASLPGLCSHFCSSHLGPPEPPYMSVQCWWEGQFWLHRAASRVLAKCTSHQLLTGRLFLPFWEVVYFNNTQGSVTWGRRGHCVTEWPKASGEFDDTLITFVSKPFLLQYGLSLMPALDNENSAFSPSSALYITLRIDSWNFFAFCI